METATTDNFSLFVAALTKHYTDLFANDPEYAYVKARTTPERLAEQMAISLKAGGASKEGEGIKRACKELGIKHTYAGIMGFLKAGKS
jgi:hypothetical protein